VDTQTHRAVPSAPPAGRGAAGSNGRAERISVRFEAGPSAAASARNALIVIDDRLHPAAMEDVRLLVSELVTNSVRHSRTGAGETIGLDVSVARGTVRVEVCDDGVGFEPRPRQPGQSKAGGWGLFLVEKLADRWGVVRNHITRVWFEIDAPRGGAQRGI
jgi:anti-sigma regulatory factor (Ser/Thr protein kinase)